MKDIVDQSMHHDDENNDKVFRVFMRCYLGAACLCCVMFATALIALLFGYVFVAATLLCSVVLIFVSHMVAMAIYAIITTPL